MYKWEGVRLFWSCVDNLHEGLVITFARIFFYEIFSKAHVITPGGEALPLAIKSTKYLKVLRLNSQKTEQEMAFEIYRSRSVWCKQFSTQAPLEWQVRARTFV